MSLYAETPSIKDNNDLFSSGWRPRTVHIRATVTGLDDTIIPFALLKHDPLPDFQQYLASFPGTKPDMENIQAAWNLPFASLSGKQHFFICAWSSYPMASSRVVDIADLLLIIATPGLLYTRWLLTRPVMRQGELVAWYQEIAMLSSKENNRLSDIILSDENRLTLGTV